jgi:hypothetical protein
MLTNIIKLVHLIIILLVLISPFIQFYILKKFVFVFLIYLLIQYISGYEKCGLTILEYAVMGEKYREGFMYRIIKPIIQIPEKYFDNYVLFVHLVYIYVLYLQLQY